MDTRKERRRRPNTVEWGKNLLIVLLVFSAASILVGGMPWQVVEDDSLRPAVLAAGLALFCGAALALPERPDWHYRRKVTAQVV